MTGLKSSVLLALGLALALSPKIAAADDGILVYNAQHQALAQDWASGFTGETGIRVTLRNGDDTELGNQIVQEGAASPADVFLTENSPAMALVDNAGLFAPVDPATLAQLPEIFKAADGKWVGIAARSTVFAYDKRKLQEADLPGSLLDLAGPEWNGRWGAAPAGADFQAIVGALLLLKGERATGDWLKALKVGALQFKSNGAAMKAVDDGQIAGAVIYHYYFFGDQAKTGQNSGNVALHYFRHQDPGAFVSLSGGGVLASSKHPAEAQAFLKWITGKGGQDVLKNGNSFEYAVGVGAESNPKLVPLDELQAPRIEPSTLNSRAVTDLMMAAGLL